MEKQSDPNRDDSERAVYKSKESVHVNSISGVLRDSSIGSTCSSIISSIFNDDPKSAVNIMSSLEKLCHLGMNADELINTTSLIVKIDKELFASDHEQTSLLAYLMADIGTSTKSSTLPSYVLKELVSNCEIDGANNKIMHIAKALASASNVMHDGKQLKRIVDFMFSLRGYVVDKVNDQARESKIPRLNPQEVALGFATIAIFAELETSKPPKSHLLKYFRNLKGYKGLAHQSGGDPKALKGAYFVPNTELIRETLAVVRLNIDAEQMEYLRERLNSISTQPGIKVEAATNAIKLVASTTKSVSFTQWMCNTSIEMLSHNEFRYVEAMRIISHSLVSNNIIPSILRDSIDSASGMPDAYFNRMVNGADQLIQCGQAQRASTYASSINRIRDMDSATLTSVSDTLLAISKAAKSMANLDIASIAESFREMYDSKVESTRLIGASNALRQMVLKDPSASSTVSFIKLFQMVSTESQAKYDCILTNLTNSTPVGWKPNELQYIRNKLLENMRLSEPEFIAKMNMLFNSLRNRK